MNAIEILQNDHRNARKAMDAILASPDGSKLALFKGLKGELEGHDHVEETIFYPALQASPKAAGLPSQDKAAHLAVESALDKLAVMPVSDAQWTPMFRAMQADLLRHVNDEETNYFVKAREVLSALELETLGEKIAAAKKAAKP